MLGDDQPKQRVDAGVVDVDWQGLADLAAVAVEDDDAVAHGSAGELYLLRIVDSLRCRLVLASEARLAWAFDQHLDLLAEELLVVLFADRVLDRQQLIVAPPFDLVGHVVREMLRPFGPGPFAVLKNKTVFETLLSHQVAGQLKIFLGLAAEADDKVARHGRVGQPLANAIHHHQIFFDRVAPFHALQQPIRGGLDRHMQIFRALRQVADRFEQIVGHVLRVIRNELYSFDPVDLVQRVKQIAETRRFFSVAESIAVDRLAEQDDFFAAFVCELLGLGENLVRRTALLGAAHAGHDAVGAKLVAADLDTHISLKRCRPHRRVAQRVETFVAALDLIARAIFASEADFQLLASARFDLLDQLGHLVQLSWANDEVDVRSSLEDQLLVFLGHAAEHADDFVWVGFLGIFQPAQGAVDFVFGLCPHAASVEQNRIGVVRAVGQFVVVLAQAGHNELAIKHVHLATDRFDVKFFCHGFLNEMRFTL